MTFDINNRRYTGSKYKLSDWIVELIDKNCTGNSFCDIFAGTSIISYKMLKKVKHLILNDFLFSNNTIYKAFYGKGIYDLSKLESIAAKYIEKNANKLGDNYMSRNFGGKFFSYHDAKMIGYIRNNIESLKAKITEKEYDILLTSLLYSSDKAANTVGHYDAYIKGKAIPDKFFFQLIKPIDTKDTIVDIYREDSNKLANTLKCDIVYIDPPYNSRQYSRFYHVLENLTKWEKPKLEGVALKPKPENMSEYCRSAASEVFKELIDKLNCKYIVVSYNNTYDSKSKSSENKMDLEFIKETLKNKGKLEIFEKAHSFFNTGKTNFTNHKEYIFIVKVGS